VGELLDANGGAKFDVVVASDCIYNPECHEILLRSASAVLGDAGVLIVGFSFHGNAANDAILAFFERAERDFGLCVAREWDVMHDVQGAAVWSKDENRGNVYIKVLKHAL
jgi:predicted nicotinamide N-methyase